MNKNKQLLELTKELQALAQAGIQFTTNPYDLERFERIREISATLLQLQTDFTFQDIMDNFCIEKGYQTPKIDTRGVVIKEDKILLVKENNGLWCIPGGYLDINQKISTNTIKEVQEEAGMNVTCKRIIALQDRDTHHPTPYIYSIVRVFVLCEYIDGSYQDNIETLDSKFFSIDELPPLNTIKTTFAQIQMAFDAYYHPENEIYFD